jgi:pimeloyl-ACP methyl ester carboxylesterase
VARGTHALPTAQAASRWEGLRRTVLNRTLAIFAPDAREALDAIARLMAQAFRAEKRASSLLAPRSISRREIARLGDAGLPRPGDPGRPGPRDSNGMTHQAIRRRQAISCNGAVPRGARRGRWVARPLLGLLVLLAAILAPLAPPTFQPAAADAPPDLPDIQLYVPGQLAQAVAAGEAVPTTPVVLVLYGMGGGRGFDPSLLEAAEREGWLLVAPYLTYGDWRDPRVVQEEDARYARELVALLDALPAQISVPVAPEAFVLGFSRGAQLGHRFALLYPERVAAAAVFAAGSYTLPEEGADLSFPFGLSDCPRYTGHSPDWTALRETPFLVGVGANDAAGDGLPRAWDQFEGRTRVERAGAFVDHLQRAGVPADLRLFPGVGHELRPEMQAAAVAFFEDSPHRPAAEDESLSQGG